MARRDHFDNEDICVEDMVQVVEALCPETRHPTDGWMEHQYCFVDNVVVMHRESGTQMSLWTCPSVSPTAPTAQDTGEDLRTLWIGCGL